MSNIAFVSNDYKTDFFLAIAKSLEEKGVEVYWFVFNKKYSELLHRHFHPERILYVHKNSVLNTKINLKQDMKLNELIYQDHSLRYQQNWAINYLQCFYTVAKEFILKNRIGCIFGELARAHECLLHRLCKHEISLDCCYLSPNMVRIPNGFYSFFADEAHHDLIGGLIKGDKKFPRNVVVEKPKYFEDTKQFISNNYSLSGRLKKVTNFLFQVGYDKDDPSKFENRLTEVKMRLAREINKELYKLLSFDQDESLPQNFIFFPLQRYPEASVEVFGRYNEEQFQHIVDLWRVMPSDWGIVVKEHATAIGERPLKFYRQLRRYKGVFIVDHELDSHFLINKASVVATVTGTAALEAALLGKISVVFGNPFFARLASVIPLRKEHFLESSSWDEMLKMAEAEKSERMKLHEYFEFIEALSFPGVISDPVSDPNCLDADNIEAVTAGFFAIIRRLT